MEYLIISLFIFLIVYLCMATRWSWSVRSTGIIHLLKVRS